VPQHIKEAITEAIREACHLQLLLLSKEVEHAGATPVLAPVCLTPAAAATAAAAAADHPKPAASTTAAAAEQITSTQQPEPSQCLHLYVCHLQLLPLLFCGISSLLLAPLLLLSEGNIPRKPPRCSHLYVCHLQLLLLLNIPNLLPAPLLLSQG
jgi:hypothetical protein